MIKKQITAILDEPTYTALADRAREERRPIAQMVRVIIERAIAGNNNTNSTMKGE